MSTADAVILGLVQGLTEFLPVSSSGHLVLGKAVLGIVEPGVVFEVFVHFGSLLAVLLVFRHDIAMLLRALVDLFRAPFHSSGRQALHSPGVQLLGYLVAASIPAAVIGLAFDDKIEAAFSDPARVCWMLIVTAAILALTAIKRPAGQPLNLRNTLLIGLAQSLAILPGISRSGSTISVGLLQKIDGTTAARFSFLLAVPAILGATLLKALQVISAGLNSQQLSILAVGTAISFAASLFAILVLLRIIQRGKLYIFAPYCLLLGIVGLILLSN